MKLANTIDTSSMHRLVGISVIACVVDLKRGVSKHLMAISQLIGPFDDEVLTISHRTAFDNRTRSDLSGFLLTLVN